MMGKLEKIIFVLKILVLLLIILNQALSDIVYSKVLTTVSLIAVLVLIIMEIYVRWNTRDIKE